MEKDELFYQSKYDYYRKFSKYVVVFGCIASTTYILSDSQLFGHFALETLLPRLAILLPLAIYLWLGDRVQTYKVMVPLSYIVVHCIMWCTIWAIACLPVKQHANEGFIIMHLLFFALGFCAPFRYSTVAHCMVAVNIIVSNLFNHYESIWQMMFLGIPCIISICAVHWVMEQSYREHYKMKCELERLTMEDQLTGAYNRNKLRDICMENGRALRVPDDKPTSVMIVDVDHFKRVNDTYGHAAGDKILVHTVSVIRQCIRSTDWILRWGGEEFVIILQECEQENAKKVAENIRQEIAGTYNGICPLTVSIGVSAYNGVDLYQTVARADTALYQAKEGGRNRVVMAQPPRRIKKKESNA